MKKIIAIILAALLICTTFVLTGCNQAENVQWNLSKNADAFNVYRKVTFMNLRTNQVLLEVEGYLSIKDSSSDEIAIIIETGKNEYQMHYLYVGGEVVYLVEQIESENINPYTWNIHIFAEYPSVMID